MQVCCRVPSLTQRTYPWKMYPCRAASEQKGAAWRQRGEACSAVAGGGGGWSPEAPGLQHCMWPVISERNSVWCLVSVALMTMSPDINFLIYFLNQYTICNPPYWTHLFFPSCFAFKANANQKKSRNSNANLNRKMIDTAHAVDWWITPHPSVDRVHHCFLTRSSGISRRSTFLFPPSSQTDAPHFYSLPVPSAWAAWRSPQTMSGNTAAHHISIAKPKTNTENHDQQPAITEVIF